MGRYPQAEILLFEFLRVIFFYPTPHHTYRAIVLAAMIYLAAQICLRLDVADSTLDSAYHVGQRIALHFGFTAYILSEGSFPNHWRRVRDEVQPRAGGSGHPPSNFSLTKKFWWTLDIAHSVRMVGWIQEPRDCLPPPPPPSRRTFLWKTLLKLIANIISLDLLTLMLAQNPAFDSRVHDPTDGPETYLAAVPLLRRVPHVLAFVLFLAGKLDFPHNVVALICVGLGRSSPTLWPNTWGRWGDAYTLRKLWGRTWHQMMRPMLSGLGRLVANKILKFPRGTNRSSYTQLYVAFFLSAAFHSAGGFICETWMASRCFKFFLLQAAAITFEDLIIYLAKPLWLRWGIKLNPGNGSESWAEVVVRVIGYCWVTLWFCLTVPVYIDEISAVGFYDTDRRPIARFLFDKWHRWA